MVRKSFRSDGGGERRLSTSRRSRYSVSAAAAANCAPTFEDALPASSAHENYARAKYRAGDHEFRTGGGSTLTLGMGDGVAEVVGEVARQLEQVLLGQRLNHPKSLRGNELLNASPIQIMGAHFLNATLTKLVMALMVAVNLVQIVVEEDIKVQGGELPRWMTTSGLGFLVFFCLELVAKILTYRKQFGQDSMNILDAVVVLVDLVGLLGEATVGNLPSFSVLRALRFLRVARLLREVVVFRELYLMIVGLLSAVRAIFFGSTFIAIILVMWAIVAVQTLHGWLVEMKNEGLIDEDCERCGISFSSIAHAMLTLMQLTVVADSWDIYARPLLVHRPMSALVLLPAYISVQLGLVNVIAAVIVDRQTAAREEDSDLQHVRRVEEWEQSLFQLSNLFQRLDLDGNGTLTKAEITHAFENDLEFRQMLEVLDITGDDMDTVYHILDPDASNSVSYKEFIQQLHYIRLMNPRTLMLFTRHFSQRGMENVEKNIEFTRQSHAFLSKRLQDMADSLKIIRDGQNKQQSLDAISVEAITIQSKGGVRLESNFSMDEANGVPFDKFGKELAGPGTALRSSMDALHLPTLPKYAPMDLDMRAMSSTPDAFGRQVTMDAVAADLKALEALCGALDMAGAGVEPNGMDSHPDGRSENGSPRNRYDDTAEKEPTGFAKPSASRKVFFKEESATSPTDTGNPDDDDKASIHSVMRSEGSVQSFAQYIVKTNTIEA
eukprot:TRINITY_DN32275_c0_g2_i2.p1 TRINITY_DN32275_c0_g2~~TRINITY_DN32275_c0_g2_i2.p1  ORF type:complete len:722 (-),score=133.39 TRINITY_DN32275_c0_g2_i2:269-2434(-)